MTKENLYGTWKCTRIISDGKEKVYKHPKTSITFTEDGLGKFKLAFIPLKFKWTFNDNILKMINVNDDRALDEEIEVTDDCIIIKAESSVSYFYKE